jgi:PilZ domain
MGERRGSQRQKSFLRGCVYFDKRRGAMDCLIRDFSEEGARIIISDTVSVPDVVELYIPHKDRTVRAQVKWRHADEVGLLFNDPASASPPAGESELTRRVARLEAEIAVLRRIVKQLKREISAEGDIEAA